MSYDEYIIIKIIQKLQTSELKKSVHGKSYGQFDSALSTR